MQENTPNQRLEFRGSMFLSLVPVGIFFAFCGVMFIGLKAFNMEALAMAGFVALLIGGVFAKSYTKYWDAAIKGISLEEVAKATCQNAKTFFGIV